MLQEMLNALSGRGDWFLSLTLEHLQISLLSSLLACILGLGLGILINALAALMIGEAVVGKRTVARQLLAPFAGAVIWPG